MSVAASKIIKRALRLAGALGLESSPRGSYVALGLDELQLLCSQLRLGPNLEYKETETVVTVGAVQSVTLGPGQTINIPRPYRIERSSFSRVGNIDRPLRPIDREEYNTINLKDSGQGWPVVCFWDRGTPTGNLFLWPVSACELHLVTTAAVALFVDADTAVDLPDGYEDMLGLLLAERLAPLLEVALRPEVAKQIRMARRIVERSNVAVPQLTTRERQVDGISALRGG